MLNFEGIRLFVERSRAVNPAFALTDENAPAVQQVCARLDGIPLAIELAAMWMSTLSVEELAARLDDRFDLLRLGSRTAPPRHQTLRGVLDWSYNLLVEPERALLRRLSVFAGGGAVEAAQSLYGDALDSPSLPALLDLLNSLVDKSLLIAEQARGRTRFQMLETIRAYGREKLRAAGESEGVRNRHLDWFVRLAEEAEVGLRGPEQIEWLERLDAELDNLRVALEWSLIRDVERGLRLAEALTWYWNLRGHWSEGPAWLSKLLAAPLLARSPGFASARAKALTAAASLAFWGSNDYAAARRWLEEAIALYHAGAPGDRWGLGEALALYGATLGDLNEPAAARTALEESLAIGESLGEEGRWISAWAWVGLADIADVPVERQAGLERSADLFRALGDRAQLPVVLARLAWFHLGQGDYATAEAYARESIVLTDQMGDVMGAAWMLKLNGDLALAQADYAQADAHYRAALERFRTLGTKVGIANALHALGEVHLAEGRHEDARAMWTEALALYTELESAKARQYLLERLERLEGKTG
jgi:predicted ATPase